MDELDIHLIKLLQLDGRLSLTELSKKISLSRPSVAERLKRLQEKGIIEGFFALVPPAAVGRKLLVMVELSEIRVLGHEFERMIVNEPDVIECHRATGHVHYYIKAALNGMDDLTKLIENLTPYGNTRTSILLGTPLVRRVILPSDQLET
ncbi:transcriptional regulators [Bacillus sp. OxB-1]|uniref:Lrp/AsnC family transcriptional regulator n=1 Tax=Bacillus sp. (strain OxB-1) TaxID=98228 RepID=UPI000581DB01|nr:Lrp/AsnC family transcriptional regulator [Bacillus sp. OxB-1]BAQ08893.1 transcriptional regulators [Bacillus sp. OxB-1]